MKRHNTLPSERKRGRQSVDRSDFDVAALVRGILGDESTADVKLNGIYISPWLWDIVVPMNER